MWGHPINIKGREFGVFSHLYPDLLEDEEKFNGFIWKENRAVLPSVTEEIRKQNTNYRRAISPEERLATFLGYVL